MPYPFKVMGASTSVWSKRTRRVGECLRKSVNRGEGTNSWNIPKFIDLLLLPQYESTWFYRRFHVGFAERAEELGEEAGYHLSKGAAVF
jgi:hypothetical protein